MYCIVLYIEAFLELINFPAPFFVAKTLIALILNPCSRFLNYLEGEDKTIFMSLYFAIALKQDENYISADQCEISESMYYCTTFLP